MLERETKLGAPPGFRLPALHDALDGVSAVEPEPVVLHSTYYDTPDLRVVRWGASLRYRNTDGWTVKLPLHTVDSVLVRDEQRIDGDPGTPPEQALDLLRAFVRSARVQPVARLRTRRHRVELRDADDKPLAEVVDDEVSVLDRTRIAARFRELEVELAEGVPDELMTAVVARLREAGAGPPDPTPKVVRALGTRALAPPDVVTLSPLRASDSVARVVQAAITASVARLITHDPGVRLGTDPEDVHQARVATRRLRSDLRTFHALVDPDWSTALRAELRWLGDLLGAVRDLDVLLARLQSRVQNLPAEDVATGRTLLAPLGTRWEDARRELLDGMRSVRYAELLDRLIDAARDPALLPDATAPAASVLPGLVRRPWNHLRREVEALDAKPTNESLHRVRIRAKRCRYAAEAAAAALGKPARTFARAVERVQEALGEHQDAVIAMQWLREAARDASPLEAFVAGELAAREQAAAAAARAAFGEHWRQARRKRLRAWLSSR